ncbi:hypothetical protein ACIP8U_41990 [Streptomyces pseudovenezuelae]|uniref:hypothetical protein n=1 Tax=Streptomyces pseudovenezuelae TaxID=67350 RepID=UPI0036EBCF32
MSIDISPGQETDLWAPPQPSPLQWGMLAETDVLAAAQVAWLAGAVSSRPSGAPGVTFMTGWIKATDMSKSDCYQMTVDAGPRHPGTEPAEPGESAPGAVVTCGNLFSGLIVDGVSLLDGMRLTIIPAHLLARVDEIRQAIHEATGEPLRLEPIDMRQSLPSLQDDEGYLVTAEDLDYLAISRKAFSDWLCGELPLGFSAITYEAFVDQLARALRADGVEPNDVDVRLKGSSTAFFAGRHKSLPTSRSDIIQAFRRTRGRLPELFELREIESRLNKRWPDLRPSRRPFDVMHTVGIDRARSDYDLQLSSDTIVKKCDKYAEELGLSPTRETTYHDVYNYVHWDLLRAAMPHLARFMDLMSDAIHRTVSIAVFASSGPPDLSVEVGALSSHFRSSDWCITSLNLDDEGGKP